MREGGMNRKLTLVTVLALLLCCAPAFAECWVVSNLNGVLGSVGSKYQLIEDGITGRKLQVNINGDQSSVTGSEGIVFTEVTPQLIMGVYYSGGYKGTVESWGIDVEHRIVP
jgi:hypothetical protein